MALDQRMNTCIVKIKVYTQDQILLGVSHGLAHSGTVHTKSLKNKQDDLVTHYAQDSPSLSVVQT